MPTYEYACRQCGEHLEVVQSFKDDPLTECPACDGPLRKVFGAVGIVLKGSGFYKTDSRSNGNGKTKAGGRESTSSSSSDSSSSSSSSTSSDSSSSTSSSSTSSSSTAGSSSTASAAAS